MATTTTPVPSLLYLDGQGRPRIQGTRFKVIHIARDVRAGLDNAGIQDAYPNLSLAQIQAAVSYYYEHKDAMVAPMVQEDAEVATFMASHPNPVTREELLKRLEIG